VIDTWRTFRSLGVYRESDADGRFRWADAPPDPVLINADHAGFVGVFKQRVSPGEEAVFTLKRSLSISGRVRNASTGKPVEQAQVDVGVRGAETGRLEWRRDTRCFAYQGRLQANVDVEAVPEFRLRIRAKGYEPFESRVFRAGEGQVEYYVSLKPSDASQGIVVSGTVLRPDGGPLVGAEVAITYPLRGPERLPGVRIVNGKLQANELIVPAKTDALGRFSLTREPDPEGRYYAVVVIHPELYAEVGRAAFEANPTITVKPWGRIEGVARIGSKLAAGEPIRYHSDRLGNPDVPRVSDSGQTKTDGRGRFAFERVVPGDVRVSRVFGEGADFRGWSNGVLVEVKAGETARAAIGGRGRPVVARIAPPAGFDPKADYIAYSEFEIESARASIPFPQGRPVKRDNSLSDWARRWWASPEGHEYRRNWFRFGQARLQPDGTIRVDDVPPGEYRLRLTYSADPIYGSGASPDRIAHASQQFTILEIPGGRSDEPFDLGVIQPKPR